MGSGVTTRLGLEYMVGTDPAAIPTDVEGLANGLDSIIAPWVQSSSAPVSPIQGQVWWNPTVTASTFGWNYYDGTSWWNILTGPQYIGSSAPSSPLCYPGLIWVNTSFTCVQLQICTAGGVSPTWLIIVPGSNGTGETLINTGSGIAWGSYSDTTKVSKAGDTMTGPLILSGAPTTGLNPATKTYTDAGDAAIPTNVATYTNKRITKRVLSLSANSATPAVNTDNYDVVEITAQTATITGFTMTGTPVKGDILRISITGTRSVPFTLGSSFEPSGGVPLSITTFGTARLDMIFLWDDATNLWRQVGVA